MQTPKKTGQSGLLFGSLAANTMDRPAAETVDRLVNAGEGFLGKILRGPGPGKTFSWILLVPAIVAFGISCYLAYTTLTATDVAGCGGGTFDCSHVLNSKYSKWLGMPVSLLAAANYLAMLIALATLCLGTATNPWRRLCWAIVACCGLTAGMAAIWFISLQAFVIGHFCPWCLGAHACGLMIGAAILWQRPFGNSLAIGGSLLAGIGISGLILGQVLAEEPPTFKITEHGPAANQQSDDEPSSQDGASEEELFNPPLDEAGETFEAPMDDSTVSWMVPTSRIAASMAFLFSSSTSTVMLVASPMQKETQQEGNSAGDRLRGRQAARDAGRRGPVGDDSGEPEAESTSMAVAGFTGCRIHLRGDVRLRLPALSQYSQSHQGCLRDDGGQSGGDCAARAVEHQLQ